MDFIQKSFDEYNSSFIKKLEQVEIYGDTGKQFLAETSCQTLYVIKTSNLEKVIEILLSDRPDQLLNSIDVDNMAKKLNMPPAQVTTGLAAITPLMSQVFSLHCNEIVAATASLAWKSSDESILSAGNF